MELNAVSRGAKESSTNQDLDKRDQDAEEDMKEKDKQESRNMGKKLKRFLWNPETRECMGRTAKSWSLILLFYFVLYTFLAGMFLFCMYIVLLTLSPFTPRYRDRVAPPGVTIRPYIKHSYNIAFKVSDPKSWMPYVINLEEFLQDYDDRVQDEKNIPCTAGTYFIQQSAENAAKKACQFKRSMLMGCSGLQDRTFGYSLGQPCILLKMNRIVGYQPGYGTPVTVSCKVQKDDPALLQTLQFYPSEVFDPMYFPYYGKLTHVNYSQPLVAIQFIRIATDHALEIQCQLNGKGITNDKNNDRFLGRIIFTLKIWS